MLFKLIVGVVLCASLCGVQAIQNATVLRRINKLTPDTLTTVIDSKLFLVSRNLTHLRVKSLDDSAKLCDMEIGKHYLQEKFEAKSLGRKILVWGIRAVYETTSGEKADHTILIVDPGKCSFKAVSTFEEDRSGLFLHSNEYVARVVTYNDSFDVFYPSLRTCAPCRFSIDGKRIDLQHQLQPEISEYEDYSRIEAFNISDVQNGYFYAHNFDNRTSVVKILDSNLNVLEQEYMDHLVEVVAVKPGINSSISICYLSDAPWAWTESTRTAHCKSFDAHLHSKFTTTLPLSDNHEANSVSVNVDDSGNLFVAVVQSQNETRVKKLTFYQLHSNGTVINTFNFGELNGDARGTWSVRGFFVAGRYCLESVEHPHDDLYDLSKEYTGDSNTIQCIAIPEMM